jgi:hypothetical protein
MVYNPDGTITCLVFSVECNGPEQDSSPFHHLLEHNGHHHLLCAPDYRDVWFSSHLQPEAPSLLQYMGKKYN